MLTYKTAKMGGLCEERSEKGRGGMEKKGQLQAGMEKIAKVAVQRSDN